MWKRCGSDTPQQTAAAMGASPLVERLERRTAVDRSSCSRLTSRRSPVRAGHRPILPGNSPPRNRLARLTTCRAEEKRARAPAILRPCPRHLSSFQLTILLAPAGSGTEFSGSPWRRAPPRPDPGGRQTPTTYASESTSVDRVPATRPPCPTSPSPTWARHSSASASSAARSSIPAIGGPCAGTPRAARSRWPPRLHPVGSTGTIAARAKQQSSIDGSFAWKATPSRGSTFATVVALPRTVQRRLEKVSDD